VHFKIIRRVTNIETIAVGRSLQELPRLRRIYGHARWRKLKGIGLVELAPGDVRRAELHWYEAVGIERREYKIKRFLL
jgi:hypothetical protein